jgi:hypothetical protein
MAASTDRLALYANFRVAQGESRKKLGFELLLGELEYLTKQIRQRDQGSGLTVTKTADALRELAGLMDDAGRDPTAPVFSPSVEPTPS